MKASLLLSGLMMAAMTPDIGQESYVRGIINSTPAFTPKKTKLKAT